MSDYKKTNDLTEKTTPVDADLLRIDDSAASFAWKKLTFANLRVWVNTFFTAFKAADNTFTGTNVFPTMNVGAGNTASGDNASATGLVNAASGNQSSVGGNACIASGNNAHADGFSSEAVGNNSYAIGFGSKARYSAQFAHANTPFVNVGDTQYTRNIQTKQTTDENEVECILNSGQRYVLVENFICACTVSIHGTNSDGAVAGFYKRQVLIKNIEGTTALIGSVQTIGTDVETGSIGGISITADNTNNSLCIKVTGKTATAINWVVENSALEVGY